MDWRNLTCSFTLMNENRIQFTEIETIAVKAVSDDNTVRSAALKLGMEKRGLEKTMEAIRVKTGLKTIGGIVAYFYRNGLIK